MTTTAAATTAATAYFGGAATPGPADHLVTTREITEVLEARVAEVKDGIELELMRWEGLGKAGGQRSTDAADSLLRIRKKVAYLKVIAEQIERQLTERATL